MCYNLVVYERGDDMNGLSPAEYHVDMMKDNKDMILSRADALCLRGYGNWNFDNSVQVYSKQKLEAPYECEVVSDFNHIDYSLIHGIPVCSTRQAFIDLLNNPKDDIQTLLEALGDYYYTHGKSFANLKLSKKDEKKLQQYSNDAIHYWKY